MPKYPRGDESPEEEEEEHEEEVVESEIPPRTHRSLDRVDEFVVDNNWACLRRGGSRGENFGDSQG